MPQNGVTDPSPRTFNKQVLLSALAVIIAGIIIALLISVAFGIVIALLGAILGMGNRLRLR